jgi:hypothetical protein
MNSTRSRIERMRGRYEKRLSTVWKDDEEGMRRSRERYKKRLRTM